MKRDGLPHRCIRHGSPVDGHVFYSCDQFPACPLCGAIGSPNVFPLVFVHFAVLGSGPVWGQKGKQHVACLRLRDGYALHKRDTFSVSGDPRVVTCPSCKGTKDWREANRAYLEADPNYRAQVEAQEIEAAVRR
jgi:hypothetical protein